MRIGRLDALPGPYIGHSFPNSILYSVPYELLTRCRTSVTEFLIGG